MLKHSNIEHIRSKKRSETVRQTHYEKLKSIRKIKKIKRIKKIKNLKKNLILAFSLLRKHEKRTTFSIPPAYLLTTLYIFKEYLTKKSLTFPIQKCFLYKTM